MLKLAICLESCLSQAVRRLTQPMRRDERGVTSVEYAVVLMLVAMVIFAAVAFLGKVVNSIFSDPKLANAITG